MLKEVLLVGAGGFAGSAARYLVSAVMIGTQPAHFLPWGTLTVNGAGALLIGFFLAVAGQGSWYYLLVAGFCGGFTTFSTFSAELLGMLRQEEWLQSAAYIAASIAICVTLVWIGMMMGAKVAK